MLSRTVVRLPVGGPYHTTRKPYTYGPGRKWTTMSIQPEGPAIKDSSSLTERGWVLKMIYMLQPITFADLWEEVFMTPFNPIHNRTQLKNTLKHLRKDLMVYLRLDPDDLQFYIYMYPQWARLTKHFIGMRPAKKNERPTRGGGKRHRNHSYSALFCSSHLFPFFFHPSRYTQRRRRPWTTR